MSINLDEVMNQINEQYKISANKHHAYMQKYFQPNYEEEFMDTINRTYEEGYSDALLFVIDLITGGESH